MHGTLDMNLYDKYHSGNFPVKLFDLVNSLGNMILEHSHVYVMIDALDECTENSSLLNSLSQFAIARQMWSRKSFHRLFSYEYFKKKITLPVYTPKGNNHYTPLKPLKPLLFSLVSLASLHRKGSSKHKTLQMLSQWKLYK